MVQIDQPKRRRMRTGWRSSPRPVVLRLRLTRGAVVWHNSWPGLPAGRLCRSQARSQCELECASCPRLSVDVRFRTEAVWVYLVHLNDHLNDGACSGKEFSSIIHLTVGALSPMSITSG